MVVTSPPYWSLRAYEGVEPLLFGGDPACDHGATAVDARAPLGGMNGIELPHLSSKLRAGRVGPRAGEVYTGKLRWQHVAEQARAEGKAIRELAPEAWTTLDQGYWDNRHASVLADDGAEPLGSKKDARGHLYAQVCTRCGCWRGHYGLEPTPQMYIEHSMEFLDAIWRVLKKSGTVFWNLGDSWAGSNNGSNDYREKNGLGGKTRPEVYKGQGTAKPAYHEAHIYGPRVPRNKNSLKPKDMALIPFRFALAAQERGWWVRSTIIWAKNNPMPESVRDRPTDAHEYIFLLTKSARYYWNRDAVREPLAESTLADGRNTTGRHTYKDSKYEAENSPDKPSWYRAKAFVNPQGGRNIRSVWSINTQPYAEAHFATFPLEIPQTCIKAGCPEDGIVLDPFAGAGTTLWAAKTLGVKSIGIELSEAYCKLAIERIRQQVLL